MPTVIRLVYLNDCEERHSFSSKVAEVCEDLELMLNPQGGETIGTDSSEESF